ncbi:uncharacterized protein LOC132558659 [Ylistrum balloti]|uniref:uncharacterized protein LOC132558659 n=1 Tax=Ylistrum balloti TaxID=509963 RepID=UPI0029058F45|nr:uncharacterized protein LOC132558659 [Ylistrum balloti]
MANQQKKNTLRVNLFKKPRMKRDYRQYEMDALTNAYFRVTEENMPVKEAARLFNVPGTTLRQRVIGAVDLETARSGPSPLLPAEEEQRLVDYVTTLASVGYCYNRQRLCNLATDLAVELGLRDKEHHLSYQWYRNFIARWPTLAVKKPGTPAIARAKGTSQKNIDFYFEELKKILTLTNLKDKPQHIYIMEEKGIVDHQSPSKTDKKTKSGAVTSGTSHTVTVLGAGNALGTVIPPYFVFPGKHMRSGWLEGATPGVSGTVSKTGLSNDEVIRQYLETHFIKSIQRPDTSEPLLLLYDGHRSDINLGIIKWAKEQNIILFFLPSFISHKLKPHNQGCFGPFQKVYDNLSEKLMKKKSNSSIPKHSTCELGCKAYSKSMSAANLRSLFLKCGIYPFNPAAVDITSFIPATSDCDPAETSSDQEEDTTSTHQTEAVEYQAGGKKAKIITEENVVQGMKDHLDDMSS